MKKPIPFNEEMNAQMQTWIKKTIDCVTYIICEKDDERQLQMSINVLVSSLSYIMMNCFEDNEEHFIQAVQVQLKAILDASRKSKRST